MYITYHITAFIVLAALVVPTSVAAFFDESFFDEIEQSVQESLERAQSVSETGGGNTNSASVINETRAEASSSGGTSEARVQSQTIINGEVVEDVDKTTTGGTVEHETNIEEENVKVQSRVKATADGADNRGYDGAGAADGRRLDRARDVGSTTAVADARRTNAEGRRIAERLQAFTERLFSLIDTYVFSIFGN